MRYVILVLALVAAAGGYTGYWHYAAGMIEPGIARWAGERRAEGFEVTYSEVSVRGFPYRLLVEVREPSIARPGEGTAWRWRGEALSAVAQPWNFHHVIFSFDGRHQIRYAAKGGPREIAAEAAVPLLSVVLDSDGALDRFDADFEGLVVEATGWSESLRVGRLQVHGRNNGGQDPLRPAGSRDLAVGAEAIDLPPEASGPLGPRLDSVDGEATVHGTLPPLPLGQALALWRDDGGTIEVRRLALNWGTLDLDASGTLALDTKMRPIGAGTAHLRGYARTIDALRKGRWIGSGEATAAKVVLNLLAKMDERGKVASVPVSAQDGRFYLGPLPLLRLAPLLPSSEKKSSPSPLP